jgi:plastocyanin domain-containing protein
VTTTQVLVTLLGIGAILWVNYYFFRSRGSSSRAIAESAGGPQHVRIEVKGGYSPSLIRVEAGQPVRLDFYRPETSGCTEEVVIPDFHIRRFLPAHRTTAVEFTPASPGSHEFTCGMGMVRGRIIVEASHGR